MQLPSEHWNSQMEQVCFAPVLVSTGEDVMVLSASEVMGISNSGSVLVEGITLVGSAGIREDERNRI